MSPLPSCSYSAVIIEWNNRELMSLQWLADLINCLVLAKYPLTCNFSLILYSSSSVKLNKYFVVNGSVANCSAAFLCMNYCRMLLYIS